MQSPQRDQRIKGYGCESPITGSPPLGPGYGTGTKHHHFNGHGPAPVAPTYTPAKGPERPDPTRVKFTAARGRARRGGYGVPFSCFRSSCSAGHARIIITLTLGGKEIPGSAMEVWGNHRLPSGYGNNSGKVILNVPVYATFTSSKAALLRISAWKFTARRTH
jgi:hypothetical protein